MSLKVISVRTLRSTLVAHMKKYIHQIVATRVEGVAAFRGSATIGANGGNATEKVKGQISNTV